MCVKESRQSVTATGRSVGWWVARLVAIALASQPAIAQQSQVAFVPLDGLNPSGATAGSPAERTLALLALLSDARVSSTLLPFDAATRDSIIRASDIRAAGVPTAFRRTPQWVALWWNQAKPRPDQDGPVWQGRGATVAAGAGLVYERRFLSVSLQPSVWAAQNAYFRPAFPGPIPDGDFRNPFRPNIDTPYRFGDKALARLEPGESWVRLGLYGASIGFSTAGQRWGPAFYYPLVMSTESAGYPRLFAETRSINLGVARATASWSVGRIESSGLTAMPPGSRSRFVPALVMSLRPDWFPGLELGATRMFHVRWDASAATWDNAMLPLQGLLKQGNPTNDDLGSRTDKNQLASIFFHVAPRGGVEVYGEFLRDDHNWDRRDLVGEPDHSSAYMVGIRRATATDRVKTLVVIETANARMSHLKRVRHEEIIHVHSPVQEGHSNRGQALGSSAIPGGGGLTFGVHRVTASQSSSLDAEMRRDAQNEEGGRWNDKLTGSYVLRYSRTRLLGRSRRSFTAVIERGYGLHEDVSLSLGLGIAR